MADLLSPREVEDVSKATILAEHGNGSRLRDLVHDDKDFEHHTTIIKAMLNVNEAHVHSLEINGAAAPAPGNVSPLKLNEAEKTVDGNKIITRSISANGRAIYREVYNDTKKEWQDSGSCPVPTGIIPPFIKKDN